MIPYVIWSNQIPPDPDFVLDVEGLPEYPDERRFHEELFALTESETPKEYELWKSWIVSVNTFVYALKPHLKIFGIDKCSIRVTKSGDSIFVARSGEDIGMEIPRMENPCKIDKSKT